MGHKRTIGAPRRAERDADIQRYLVLREQADRSLRVRGRAHGQRGTRRGYLILFAEIPGGFAAGHAARHQTACKLRRAHAGQAAPFRLFRQAGHNCVKNRQLDDFGLGPFFPQRIQPGNRLCTGRGAGHAVQPGLRRRLGHAVHNPQAADAVIPGFRGRSALRRQLGRGQVQQHLFDRVFEAVAFQYVDHFVAWSM